MAMQTGPTVVVGFDGSPTARGALRFAAEEAVRRSHPLRIVSVRERRYPQDGECAADELLELAADLVRPLIVPGRVTRAAPFGPTVGALLAESDHADLLVLGRGEPRVSDMLFGSTTSKVVPAAHCPVVIVGDADSAHMPHTGPVVVGLDVARISTEALEEAFVEASIRARDLVVLCATRPRGPRAQPAMPLGLIAPPEDPGLEDQVRAVIAPMRARHPAVPVTVLCRPGSARQELLDVGSAASLVVVGSRHRRPAASLLLGSVGSSLVRHAGCPVMVAHPRLSHLARRLGTGSAASREAALR